ncbi:SDR family oxidoreductase [Pseudooceanicola sp. CBS1P-1]|uniref:SDR family oxidoreductase n=1 Tax=Pseudooceanicola albus TaxID=2692189 RepID=A0A6L7G894_9RHOB|nr:MULTISPECIES: SDR family NAD(P)-dependent oxidoreductase [Pseudooceanicola]MBT9386019.1 SDR family oxidoreductase [Pseudooceanicola endophyticus]MXN19560.1 SDR family oxidoreductase [Pseudooceanicola albus]
MEMKRFEGQVAVVTGGARGIGRAVAERLASEGARVVIWDLKGAEEAAAALPGNALGLAVDVGQEASVAAAAERTEALCGQVDILVTAAGITGETRPVQGHPYDSWRRVVDIHLGGVFLCARSLLDGMVARDRGRIIAVASVAGKEGNPNASSYSAAKAGIIGFIKSLGKELAPTGVRANVIAPGLINAPLMEQLPPEQVAFSLSKIPQGRFGTVEECAAMIAFMASAECSFCSGAVFDLSGGRATY